MLRFYKSRTDRIRFISSLDEAVDTSTPEARAAYREYLKDLDVKHLTVTGEPTVLVMRPLTHEVVGLAAQLSLGLAAPGVYLDPQAAREMVRLSTEAIEPAPDGWTETDLYRWEYRRRVLSPETMAQLPDGLIREAAQVLVDTLPAIGPRASGDETDPFVLTTSEGSSGSSSGVASGSGSTPPTAPTAESGTATGPASSGG